jgi:hypothetical protein
MSAITTQVTMPIPTFRNGLRDALLFAGVDDTLPSLAGVWLDWDGTTLTAYASDRFYIGRTTFRSVTVNEAGETWRRFLPAMNARIITAALKPVLAEQHGRNVRVVVSGTSVLVETAELTLTTPLNSTVQDFGIAALLDKILATEAPPNAGFAALNPQRLARFSKVSRDYDAPNRIHIAGATDPVAVQIGDHFAGLVMPVCLGDTEAVRYSGKGVKRRTSCGDCDGPCGDCDDEAVIEMENGPNIVCRSAEEREAIQAAMRRNGEILRESEGGAA